MVAVTWSGRCSAQLPLTSAVSSNTYIKERQHFDIERFGQAMARKPTPNQSGAERAAKLREQIRKLKEGTSSTDESHRAEEKLSPRDFIHKRMRELDQKK